MPEIQDFEIVGSYNNQRFPNIDAERTINMFEYIDQKGKKPKSLLSTSGLLNTGLDFSATTTGFFRAEFVFNGFEFFVVGADIWKRDQNNNLTKLNSPSQLFHTGVGYVGIDANNASGGGQVLFVDGTLGSIYDTATGIFTYNVISVDPNFPKSPVDVCFIDGFLVVANGGTNGFQLSAFNNAYSWGLVESTLVTFDHTTNLITPNTGTVYTTGMQINFTAGGGLPPEIIAGTTYYAIFFSNAQIRIATTLANALSNTFLTFSTNGTPPNTITNLGASGQSGQLQQAFINSHPGNIVACRTLHRRVFLFSMNFTEVWENSGQGSNLPLRRNNNLLMEYGTPAVGSIVTGFDKMIFLSQDKDGLGAVMEVIGTESIPISNRALDFQLAQYAELQQISDAQGIFIKENGIIFYRLNFTAANHTFVYDVTLSDPRQEEGKLWHEEQVLNGDRHPAQTHGYFFGNNYFGAYNSLILYQVDSSFVTNDGEAIARIRIGRAYVPATYNRTRCDRFMLDVIQGLAELEVVPPAEIDLLTETLIPITTESGINILLEPGNSGFSIFNLAEPVVFLSISKDGGVTFGHRLNGTVGAIGDRTHRTVWRKLGVIPRGQAFVPKIEFFNQVPFIILGAAWVFEVLPE
jgi:hypothetical protein